LRIDFITIEGSFRKGAFFGSLRFQKLENKPSKKWKNYRMIYILPVRVYSYHGVPTNVENANLKS
jgi:hypothetical protein